MPPVERHVKERLIGAAVLVAAAVILIPEMLSGPDSDPENEERAIATSDAPLKTYTIDLSKSASQATAAQSDPMSTAAPPPESSPVAPDPIAATDEAIPESNEGGNPTDQAVAVTPEPAPAPATPTVVPQPRPEPAPARPEPMPAAPNGGWAVQLGSFSTRATADGLATRMKANGVPAFVMPVNTGAKTLYRVRIGPLPDREAATATLGKVKASVPAATVVKHP